ncbi:peptidoglycan-binding protein [Radiobacillus kanasensis]|uniref:peptidoglycan-binding protein n=1 Tax=Radiobacillus kanasensis TaxID=2844358 RepID=UPI001E333882|nr:peptidoglycan-binding protein [Radiobacillus kanasensis]UFT99254.1 peptidoglycan-binding protein [Radiobacillus kanasensis]
MKFNNYDVKIDQNGQLQIVLHVDTYSQDFLSEFSVELDPRDPRKDSLKQTARAFVRKHFPKLKIATIVVVAGSTILASFPVSKVEAHEVTFNMSYLYFGNTQSYITQIDRTKGNLSVVSPSYFDLNADGSLKITAQFDPTFIKEMHDRGIKVVPFLSNHWDRSLGRSALDNREKLSSQIAEFMTTYQLDGVQVDIENVTDLDRSAYTDLVRLLREKIPQGKEVSVAVAANPNGWGKGWHGSYDYKELAKYANYLMVMSYDESYEGSPEGPVASYDWVERSIQYALNQEVPPEKIVLGIPFYGRYWKEGAQTGGRGISNRRVEELIAEYGGKVTFDEASKSPKATVTIGSTPFTVAGTTLSSGTYHIWYENADSIKAKLELVHKYHLKGTGSWSLGQEDPSIWQDYKNWISHDADTAPPALPEPDEKETSYDTYIVRSGDSLWKIASMYQLTVQQLKAINGLNSDVIYVGQMLIVSPSAPTSPTTALIPKTTSPTVPKQPTVVQPPKVTSPSLKVGSKGTAVTNLQNNLKKLGLYKGKTNGTFDTATKNSVIAFQKKYKLKATGVADATTLKKINDVVKSSTKKDPTLKVGSRGSAVVDLQNKLKKTRHYKGKAHGTYDTATKNAVIAFQKKYKLKADGIANATTISKLSAVTKPTTSVKKYPTLKVGTKGSAVTDLQNKLKKTGHYKKRVHGTYDSATKSAVIAFQKKYKLKADGIASPITLSKLDAVTRAK